MTLANGSIAASPHGAKLHGSGDAARGCCCGPVFAHVAGLTAPTQVVQCRALHDGSIVWEYVLDSASRNPRLHASSHGLLVFNAANNLAAGNAPRLRLLAWEDGALLADATVPVSNTQTAYSDVASHGARGVIYHAEPLPAGLFVATFGELQEFALPSLAFGAHVRPLEPGGTPGLAKPAYHDQQTMHRALTMRHDGYLLAESFGRVGVVSPTGTVFPRYQGHPIGSALFTAAYGPALCDQATEAILVPGLNHVDYLRASALSPLVVETQGHAVAVATPTRAFTGRRTAIGGNRIRRWLVTPSGTAEELSVAPSAVVSGTAQVWNIACAAGLVVCALTLNTGTWWLAATTHDLAPVWSVVVGPAAGGATPFITGSGLQVAQPGQGMSYPLAGSW